MENNKSLTVIGQGSVPAFVEAQMASLDGAMKYAEALLKSKMCPAHFYEKKKEGDGQYAKTVPDYEKGKPEAVLMVLQHGREIGLSYMQSLQQIVPVNGLVAIKGDGAKSLIMGSGLCESWEEKYVGDENTDSWGCTITSKRKGTGETHSVTFTVADAKRASLWVTDDMLNKTPSLKYGGWYKYPKRMLRYRALGFLARDMYSDVLQGTFIEEEARDIDVDNTKVTTETGIVVDHTKIEKANAVSENAKGKKAKGQPEKTIPIQEVKKEEPVSEEPKVEPAPKKEQTKITDNMLNLKGPELWERVTSNWPYPKIDPIGLFDAEKNLRTVPKVRALLQAIADGNLSDHLSKQYGISVDPIQGDIGENLNEGAPKVKETAPTSKKEIMLPDYITEPGETGRDMVNAVKVADFMDGKVSAEKILDMYPDLFNDIEDFFKQATIEQIKLALG